MMSFNSLPAGYGAPATLDRPSIDNLPTMPDDSPITATNLTSTLTTIQPATVTVSGNLSEASNVLSLV